jgi:hypothetical protein
MSQPMTGDQVDQDMETLTNVRCQLQVVFDSLRQLE